MARNARARLRQRTVPTRHRMTNAQGTPGANVLTIDQVARLAIRAGFSRRDGSAHLAGFSQAAVAVAIAKHESGFNANAVNPSSGATGLWQIHGPGQSLSGTPALMNPTANATAARAKYLAQGWKAWSVYPTVVGADAATLQAADAAVRKTKGLKPRDPGAVQEITPVSLGGDILGGLTGWVGDLFKVALPVLKIAAGGGGLLVCAIALVYVAGRNTPPVAAAREAAKLVPAGKLFSGAVGAGARASGRASAAAGAPARPDLDRARAERQALTERGRTARVRAAEGLAARRGEEARRARYEAEITRHYVPKHDRVQGVNVETPSSRSGPIRNRPVRSVSPE